MSDARKDESLTTADLAAMGPPAKPKPGAGAPAPREYSEEPRPRTEEAKQKAAPAGQTPRAC
jgi:hypothetical protein